MATLDIGNHGEDLATNYLEQRGFFIVARNWRTRWCEIDIVARHEDCMFFIEVETRKNDHFGDGFDYITPKKLQQMRFSAKFWLGSHNWQGEVALAAISVTTSTGAIEFTVVQ